MIEFNNTEVVGWEHAIRGMRNPMNSWDKSDSVLCTHENQILPVADSICVHVNNGEQYWIGPEDQALMEKLVKAGSDHRKFMRMIVVYTDITAPLYFWKEFDTYKVGTVANSCSTMHKLGEEKFTFDDFSCRHLGVFIPAEKNHGEEVYQNLWIEHMRKTIEALNIARAYYICGEDPDLKKEYWWQMIQLLPNSYNQKRTVMMNYEVLRNIYHARREHKLDEWRVLCNTWIYQKLPYSELITM